MWSRIFCVLSSSGGLVSVARKSVGTSALCLFSFVFFWCLLRAGSCFLFVLILLVAVGSERVEKQRY